MGFKDELEKALAARKITAPVASKPAKATTKKTGVASQKVAPVKPAKAKVGASKSGQLDKKYPGGSWRTMRGHHIYIMANGRIAPETLPKDKKTAQALTTAHHAKKAAPKVAAGVKDTKAVQTVAKASAAAKEKGRQRRIKEAKQAVKATDRKREMESPTLTHTRWTRDTTTGENSQVTIEAKGKVSERTKGAVVPTQEESRQSVRAVKKAVEKRVVKPDIEDMVQHAEEVLYNPFGENVGQTYSGDFRLPKMERIEKPDGRHTWKFHRSEDGRLAYENVEGNITEEEYLDRMQPFSAWAAKDFIKRRGFDPTSSQPFVQDWRKELKQEFQVGLFEGLREWADAKTNNDIEKLNALRDPSTFAIARGLQRIKRYGTKWMEQIGIPRAYKPALAAYSAARNSLLTEGVTVPSRDQIMAKLDGNETFGKFVPAGGAQTAMEKMRVLENLYHINSIESMDNATNSRKAASGENKITGHDVSASGVNTEDEAVGKVTTQERKDALMALMDKAGLAEDEVKLLQMRHGFGSGFRTTQEIDATNIGQVIGASPAAVRKRLERVTSKIRDYVTQNPEEKNYLLSLKEKGFVNTLIKSLFEADMDDMLEAYGLGWDILDWAPTRHLVMKSLETLTNELEPTEYAITKVAVPGVGYRVTLAEPVLPPDSVLKKALTMADLQQGAILKSFGDGKHRHAANAKELSDMHRKVREWVNGAGRQRFESHVKEQGARLKGKSGGLTWSEQLLAENPGSAWITWGGHHILIQGGANPSILYSSADSGSGYDPERQKHVQYDAEGEESGEQDFHEKTDDYGAEHAQGEEATKKAGKLGNLADMSVEEMKKRYFGVKNSFVKDPEMKERVGKNWKEYHPPGTFLAVGPDGKRVVYKVDLVDASAKGSKANKKDEEGNVQSSDKLTTALTEVWSIDDAEGRGVSKHEANYGEIFRLLYGKGPKDVVADLTGKRPDNIPIVAELMHKLAYGAPKAGLYGDDHNMPDWTDKAHKLTSLTDDEWHSILSKTENAAKEVTTKQVQKELSSAHEEVQVHGGGSKTFIKHLKDGRVAKFNVGADGQLEDPVMRQLIDTSMLPNGIREPFDLAYAITQNVNNTAWVTISPSQWRPGEGAHHHLQLKLTGLGAPVVVGGPWDGKLYADSADLTNPEDKQKALFRNGKLVEGRTRTTAMKKVAHEEGNEIKFRMKGQSKWQTGTIEHEYIHDGQKTGVMRVRVGDETLRVSADNAQLTHVRKKDTVTGSLPLVDWQKDHLVAHVPEAFRQTFKEDLKIAVNEKTGTADMSLAQFEQFREVFGGFTLTDGANDTIDNYLKEQSKPPHFLTPDERAEKYQPLKLIAQGGKMGEAMRKLVKNPDTMQDFYDTQLEGVHFLKTVKRGVAGHGMGTGKTLLGVLGTLHNFAEADAAGVPRKKTLIVAPSGIRSDWLKEFNRHTNGENLKVAVMGGVSGGREGKFGALVKDKQGNIVEDLRSDYLAHDPKNGKGLNMDDVNHDVVVVSQDFFANNSDLFTQGHFDSVMLDEVHNLKNIEGNRGNALKNMAQAKGVKNVWGLSGTPMENDPTELHNLIHMGTMGQHSLGSKEEFLTKYFERRGGKVVRVKPEMITDLGKTLSKYVQFRGGEDVGVEFPHLADPVGAVGAPNAYHGAKVGVHQQYDIKYVKLGSKGPDGQPVETTPDDPDAYRLFTPNLNRVDNKTRHFYKRYYDLEQKLLGQNEIAKIRGAAATGYDNGGGASSAGYLSGVNHLQQFMNAPDAFEVLHRSKEYQKLVDSGEAEADAALESAITKKGRYHGVMDESGNFVPIHQNSPMADWVGNRVRSHLNATRTLNANRAKQGMEAIPPKMVLSSQFVGLGTKVLENVVEGLRDEYPELKSASYVGSGDSEAVRNRDNAAMSFNQKDGPNIMIMSSAAKEGKDFGTGQVFVSLDHEWNPQRTAQKVARTRRSDSKQKRAALGADNRVSVESPFLPGTIHNDILNAHDRKIANIEQVIGATKTAEKGGAAPGQAAPKYEGALASEQRRFGSKDRPKADPVETARRQHQSLTEHVQELRANAKNTKTSEVKARQYNRDTRKFDWVSQKVEHSDKAAGASRRNLLRQADKLEAKAQRLAEKHGFSQPEVAAVNKSFGGMNHVILLGR